MLALSLAIITETFPAATRAAAIGTWAAIGGMGFGVRTVVGGVLLTFFGWAMNGPFLLAAQLGGRLDRRYPPARVVAVGCAVAAIGFLALSRAASGTPFALTAAGYLLAGAGFGVLVPGAGHVAMRDVTAGASRAASGVVNAARQVGASVGLDVLGSLGVGAAISAWGATVGRLPASARPAAAMQTPDVAGADISAVAQALGPAYRDAAARAFAHGYQLAVGVGAICLQAAAVTAILGFRQPPPSAPPGPAQNVIGARDGEPGRPVSYAIDIADWCRWRS